MLKAMQSAGSIKVAFKTAVYTVLPRTCNFVHESLENVANACGVGLDTPACDRDSSIVSPAVPDSSELAAQR
jgi:hypothetical protein